MNIPRPGRRYQHATRDDFAGGWSGVWDRLTPGEHDPGPAG
jgi:hypothetical protein